MVLYYRILKNLTIMGCFTAARVTSMQWLLLNVAEFGYCCLHVHDAFPTSFSPCSFKENLYFFMPLINVSYNKNVFSKASVAVLWLFSFFNAQLFWNMSQLLSASSLAWKRCINWYVPQQLVSVSHLCFDKSRFFDSPFYCWLCSIFLTMLIRKFYFVILLKRYCSCKKCCEQTAPQSRTM